MKGYDPPPGPVYNARMNWDTIDVILLDWGGTLARVATQDEAWLRGARAVCDVLARHGFTCPDASDRLIRMVHEAEIRAQHDPSHVEVDVNDLFAEWATACGWPRPGDAVRDEAVHAFGENWIGCLHVYPWTTDTLAALHTRGYRLGVASNCWTPSRYVHAELDRHGFRPFVHGVTLSCEVGYRKPARVLYETALRAAVGNGALPPPERVLFVGDSPIPDIAGPAAMGMKTALVRNDESPCPREEFEQVSPDLRLDTVTDLLRVLPG